MGIPEPNLGVLAGIQANAKIAGLFGSSKSSSAQLINISLALRLGLDTAPASKLCGLSSKDADGDESVAEVLGIDFLPSSYRENLNIPESEAQDKCITAYNDFKQIVNRAKKAMRDAENLLKQYRKSLETGEHLGNLCMEIVDTIPFPSDLPPDEAFPPIEGSWDCSTEPPEETINRFIRYYTEVIMTKLKEKAKELAAATIDQATGAVVDPGIMAFGGTQQLFKVGDEKEITLFNNTFMVGPVPANLEVFLSLAYGFGVDAYYSFTPATVLLELLELNDTSEASPIANVGIRAQPYLAARVGLFVGVGFDFGVAAAKAGIEGIVSLAEISVPANAGVGLELDAVEDKRALPRETMALFNDAASIDYNIYPKKFHLNFVYDFGVGLHFTDILAGQINLKLKLRFLFFSKTWKKQIAKWNGFCPSVDENGNRTTSRQSWCDISLFNFKGKIETDNLKIPWGTIKLNVAFPQFEEIPRNDFIEQPGSGTLDFSESEKFNWHAQCGRIF